VIEIDDGPLPEISDAVELPIGKIGELIVAGPMVTKEYVVRRDQNAIHKIADGQRLWHRMGDVGYLDDRDRFWFCGRKAHRVTMPDRTLFSIPCEAIFNAHPAVFRSALVPRGERPNQTPVILIETDSDHAIHTDQQQQQLRSELLELAARNPLTRRISEIIIRRQPLPVDIRHNSKIFREQLAAEVAKLPPSAASRNSGN
jgi:acyl-coenzyme A synthetase/AMP-(fatty) acid ligase